MSPLKLQVASKSAQLFIRALSNNLSFLVQPIALHTGLKCVCKSGLASATMPQLLFALSVLVLVHLLLSLAHDTVCPQFCHHWCGGQLDWQTCMNQRPPWLQGRRGLLQSLPQEFAFGEELRQISQFTVAQPVRCISSHASKAAEGFDAVHWLQSFCRRLRLGWQTRPRQTESRFRRGMSDAVKKICNRTSTVKA